MLEIATKTAMGIALCTTTKVTTNMAAEAACAITRTTVASKATVQTAPELPNQQFLRKLLHPSNLHG